MISGQPGSTTGSLIAPREARSLSRPLASSSRSNLEADALVAHDGVAPGPVPITTREVEAAPRGALGGGKQ